MNFPEHAPFESGQKASLSAALAPLSPAQLGWLGGYLSGVSTGVSAAAPASQAKPKLTVLFGSESGNAEGLAGRVQKEANKRGFKTKVTDMADAKVKDLEKAENVLVLVSTWGDGDPPDRAVSFYEAFMADEKTRLDKVNFSVLALGDTSYEHFCKMGKDFDTRLESMGANRIFPRQDCDVDFEEPFEAWMKGALDALGKVTTVAAAPVSVLGTVSAPAAVEYGKKNPFPAELTERIVLNGTGSSKETLHLELSLEGSGLSYEAGDALALVPKNCPSDVEAILKTGNFDQNVLVKRADKSEGKLIDALTSDYDITGLSKLVLKKYNAYAQSPRIEKLLDPENKGQLQDYLYGRQIVDMLIDFPAENFTESDLISIFRKLPPRLYSIASSLKAHEDEVHLTIAAVRYSSHGRDRKGVASTFTADRIDLGDKVPVYIHKNKNFKLPTDSNTPVIMVGPGTGIAPFRAFIEERAAEGAKGPNWLFFGDQHYSYDFLYQTEWQSYLADGVLTKLDVAFSRDTPRKYYVQHVMLENSKELYKWIAEGAHFYVCGDASRMANDVNEALIEIVEKEGGKSREDAEAFVKQLQKDKRYQRDVY